MNAKKQKINSLNGNDKKTPSSKEKISNASSHPIIKNYDVYYYAGLMVVLFLIFSIRKNYFNIPFERDEGSYAYAGKIILDGAIPYIDIGSQRLDGVFYSYALLVAVFGYSVKALHIAFLVMNMASVSMLFFLTRKLSNNITGLAAAAFFALLSMAPGLSGFTIQSEHIVAFLIIAAFLVLVYFFETKKIVQLIVSGILFSFAFQVKQTSFFYGVLAGAILLFKGFFEDKSSIKQNLIYVVVFGFAVLAPILFDLLMIYKNGAWADFNLWFFEIRKQYTSLISFDQGLEYLKITFLSVYHDYKIFWIFSFIATVGVFLLQLLYGKKLQWQV